MTPHHTRLQGKRYGDYTSMDVIRKRLAAELRGTSSRGGCSTEAPPGRRDLAHFRSVHEKGHPIAG